MSIEVRNLRKTFGNFVALDNVSLDVPGGELVALLGPSGSGKTTLLRIIAGLEPADQGNILFHGENATDRPVRERQVGFVFQHYALFRHMSVFENVAFGLRVRPRRVRPPEAEIRETVMGLLSLVQLDVLAERRPSELSGGQRQRVALARALAVKPKVLLLGEPFGALDAKVRKELRRWLRDLHDSTGLTTIFVTHDQEEALALADRVAIMAAGRIEQVGSPTEVYEGPETPFVYDFLGRTNAFDCVVERGRARLGDKEFPVNGLADGPAIAFVRPHDVVLCLPDNSEPSEDAKLPDAATVRLVTALGPKAWVELSYDSQVVAAEITRDALAKLGMRPGSRCTLQLRLPCFFARR